MDEHGSLSIIYVSSIGRDFSFRSSRRWDSGLFGIKARRWIGDLTARQYLIRVCMKIVVPLVNMIQGSNLNFGFRKTSSRNL